MQGKISSDYKTVWQRRVTFFGVRTDQLVTHLVLSEGHAGRMFRG